MVGKNIRDFTHRETLRAIHLPWGDIDYQVVSSKILPGGINLIPPAISHFGTTLKINKIRFEDMPGEFNEGDSCCKRE